MENQSLVWILFEIGIIILFIVFLRRHKGSDKKITDKQATVLNGFTEHNLSGTVDFRGKNRTAESDTPLEQGERVIVTEANGSTLKINRINSSSTVPK